MGWVPEEPERLYCQTQENIAGYLYNAPETSNENPHAMYISIASSTERWQPRTRSKEEVRKDFPRGFRENMNFPTT